MSLFSTSTASAALDSAIETGLLWLLAEKPVCAEEIIYILCIPGKRGYYWLQLLEEIVILESCPGGYSPSALVREAILETYSQENWKRLVVDERKRM